ncbi:hypothetical protein BCR36DRAFT_457661 [Piromyces finnis]|uniref:Uncharacterized protein n=1 Tax=Piromyces finnis TaxID=1754191 RepID=A0A1Y1V1W4_9FUNG|nr:hypothetical protein BCR36DRAFT_457661 [Piromyces finnis]|eukprot:ORX45371.1 hypothetical protein BCR36DRAFT_457661 [Piromyces finnis]
MNLNIYTDKISNAKNDFLYPPYASQKSTNTLDSYSSNIDSPNSRTLIINGFKDFNNTSSLTIHKHRLVYELILLVIYISTFILSICYTMNNLYDKNKYGLFSYINIIFTLLLIIVIAQLSKNIFHNFNNNYPVQKNKLYNIVYISSFFMLYIIFYIVNNIVIKIKATTREDWKQNLDIYFFRFFSGFIIFLLYSILFLYWILVEKYNTMIKKPSKHNIII